MTEAHWKPSEAPTCRVCESAIYVCDSWADRRPVPCAGYDLRKAEARVAELESAHQRADNIESQAYNGLARGHAPRVDKVHPAECTCHVGEAPCPVHAARTDYVQVTGEELQAFCNLGLGFCPDHREAEAIIKFVLRGRDSAKASGK